MKNIFESPFTIFLLRESIMVFQTNQTKMKNLFLTLIVVLPLFANAQAHLGSTEWEIRSIYPDKVFDKRYTSGGIKYIKAKMQLGTFFYYFGGKTGLSKMCLQLPESMIALNTQVEIYNNKYVIISETSWKAYLEDGGIMEISLLYYDDLKAYVFVYTN